MAAAPQSLHDNKAAAIATGGFLVAQFFDTIRLADLELNTTIILLIDVSRYYYYYY